MGETSPPRRTPHADAGPASAVTRRGWLLFAALAVIWGLPYFFIRISVRQVSPALLVLVRTGGSALVLVPLAAARGALVAVLRRWRPVVLFTVVEMGVPWIVLFHAEQHVSSSVSALVIATVPLFAAIVAWLTGSERVDTRRAAGLLLGFGGVAVLVGFDVGRSDLADVLSLTIVSLGYALGPWILARYLGDLPGLGVMAASLALCALAYCPVALTELPARPLAESVVVSAATLTVLCTAVAFLAFFALVAEVGAVRTTVITYANPAVALLLGVTALGEHLGPATVAGFALIIGGSVVATRRSGGVGDTVAAARHPDLDPGP